MRLRNRLKNETICKTDTKKRESIDSRFFFRLVAEAGFERATSRL